MEFDVDMPLLNDFVAFRRLYLHVFLILFMHLTLPQKEIKLFCTGQNSV
jgi:hypothetical protein